MTKSINSSRYLLIFVFPLFLFSFLYFFCQSDYFITSPSHYSPAILLDLIITCPAVTLYLLHRKGISKIYAVPVLIVGIYLATYAMPIGHETLLESLRYVVIPLLEGAIVIGVINKIYTSISEYKKENAGSAISLDFYDQLKLVLHARLPSRVATLAINEIATFYYLFAPQKKEALRCNEFSYAKGGGGIISYAFLGIMAIELFTVHLLMQKWNPTVAWILTAVSIYGMLQIVGMIAGIKHRPIVITEHSLILRYSFLNEATIPLHIIDKVEVTRRRLSTEKGNAVLSTLGEMESQNLIIHLKEKMILDRIYGLKKEFVSIGLFVDEKEQFVKRLNESLIIYSTQ